MSAKARNNTKIKKIHTQQSDYKLKSDCLSYQDGKVLYSLDVDYTIDLNKYFIPIATTKNKVVRLPDENKYLNTALAILDQIVRKSRNQKLKSSAFTYALRTYWCTIIFFRQQGIFSLSDLEPQDLHKFAKLYAEGGWDYMFHNREKALEILDNLDKDSFCEATHMKHNVVSEIKRTYWRKHMGFYGSHAFSVEWYRLFEIKAEDLGYQVDPRIRNKTRSGFTNVTYNSLRHFFTHLNNFHTLPTSVDRIPFRPFDKPVQHARKLAHAQAGRTKNLDIEQATHTIGIAMNWVYVYGPQIIHSILQIRKDFKNLNNYRRSIYLSGNEPFKSISEQLNIPRIEYFGITQHRQGAVGKEQSLDFLIGAIQGACATIIAAFNARRNSEICSKITGLRAKDLVLYDTSSNIFQSVFYIEKSYQDRHTFYVNKTTADAIKLLIDLKRSCLPLEQTPNDIDENESLFFCHRWTKQLGPHKNIHFYFSQNHRQARSLTSFQHFIKHEYENLPISAHMWRRYFALLYVYQYDHFDLQSLRQHLCHDSIHQTSIYITDPSSRVFGERIADKFPDTKNSHAKNYRLLKSLEKEDELLSSMIKEVSKEKFFKTVSSILSPNESSGGFPRLLRKLYSKMSSRLSFQKLSESKQSEFLTKYLLDRGYQSNSLFHGQCSAPDHNFNYEAKCASKGKMDKSKASAQLCENCIYHYTNENYLRNLELNTRFLQQDESDPLVPPFIKEQNSEELTILRRVIKSHRDKGKANQILMKKTKHNKPNKK